MTRRSILFAAGAGVNLLVLAFVALWVSQCPPASWRAGGQCPGPASTASAERLVCPDPICPRAKCPEPAPAPQPAAAAVATAPATLRRYVVCERLSAKPALHALRWGHGDVDAVAVHCGESVHVIALDSAGPRRIVRLRKSLPSAQLHALSAPVIAADVSGDGLDDLVVGFAWEDATSAPRSGALVELVRDRRGTFTAPSLLAPLHVAGLVAAAFDAEPGADLAVLQRADVARGQPNELLLFHGGPSPLKRSSLKVSELAAWLTLLDLDLDGRPELVVGDHAGAGAGPAHTVAVDERGQLAMQSELDPSTTGNIVTGDVDGDGHPDLLTYDTEISVVFARSPAPSAPVALQPLPTQNLALVDLDGHAGADVIAVTDAAVTGLAQTAPLKFEARLRAPLPNADFSRDGLTTLRARERTWIAVVGHSIREPQHGELLLIPSDVHANVVWDDERTPLEDAPLTLDATVP